MVNRAVILARKQGAIPFRKMNTKFCSVCREGKPLVDFVNNGRHGKHHRCKPCEVQRTRERRAAGTMQIAVAGWQERNPEKVAAHRAYRSAVKSGKVSRRPCAVCGSCALPAAHHGDYTKPLNVTPFCLWHHHEHHRHERLYGPGQMVFREILDQANPPGSQPNARDTEGVTPERGPRNGY